MQRVLASSSRASVPLARRAAPQAPRRAVVAKVRKERDEKTSAGAGGVPSLPPLPPPPERPPRLSAAPQREQQTPAPAWCGIRVHLFPPLSGLARPTRPSPVFSLPSQASGGMEQVGSAYANALVEAAQSKGALDAVHADVDALQV